MLQVQNLGTSSIFVYKDHIWLQRKIPRCQSLNRLALTQEDTFAFLAQKDAGLNFL